VGTLIWLGAKKRSNGSVNFTTI
jgi:hypothetical protein